MGIQGLLPKLKSITNKKHIQEYKGQRVAIDGYVWLHRGAYCCCAELCQGIKTDKYLTYALHMIGMLQHYGVIPVVVLDGKALPMKKHTEIERRSNRQQNLAMATEHLRKGNLKDANEFFKKAVDITEAMANLFIEKLKQMKVDYVVAPYEADAQLAYLQRSGNVTAVITEDSDLIPFGCGRIFYKMDRYGNGEEINLEHLEMNKEIELKGFSSEMIVRMCILAGCDYLSNIDGIGIVNAFKIVKEHQNSKQILRYLEKTFSIPPNYAKGFIKAEMTFHSQVVLDTNGKRIHLTPLSRLVDVSTSSFLGRIEEEGSPENAVMSIHHHDAMIISSLSKPKRKNITSEDRGDNRSKKIKNSRDLDDEFISDAMEMITNAQIEEMQVVSPVEDTIVPEETELPVIPMDDLVRVLECEEETQLDEEPIVPIPPVEPVVVQLVKCETVISKNEIIVLSEDSNDGFKVYEDPHPIKKSVKKIPSPKKDKSKKKSLSTLDKNQSTINVFLKKNEVIDLSIAEKPSIFQRFLGRK
jgi:exonuclease-1